jgi:hypothetical protein
MDVLNTNIHRSNKDTELLKTSKEVEEVVRS